MPFIESMLSTPRGGVLTRLYDGGETTRAAIFAGGVGGGFDSPARGVYERLCEELSSQGIAGLRVRYRDARDLEECVLDVLAAIAFLEQHGMTSVALIGHSMGGAAVIDAAAECDCAATVVAISTQSYGADRIEDLSCPILFIHGTADEVLPPYCSTSLFELARAPKQLHLIDGGSHVLDEHAEEVYGVVREWILAYT